MQQNAPDHLTPRIYAGKGRHSRSQPRIRVFNHQFHTIRRLLVLIGFAFAPDFGDTTVKDLVGKRAHFEPYRQAFADVGEFAFRYLQAQQHLPRVGDATDFRAFLKMLGLGAEFIKDALRQLTAGRSASVPNVSLSEKAVKSAGFGNLVNLARSNG